MTVPGVDWAAVDETANAKPSDPPPLGYPFYLTREMCRALIELRDEVAELRKRVEDGRRFEVD
jgi:hypothetical protein